MPKTRKFSDARPHSGGHPAPWVDESIVAEGMAGSVLDGFLAAHFHLPEEEARDLVDFGSVQVNGKQERNPLRKLQEGDRIRIHWPWGGTRRHYELDADRVIYRDGSLLAYNKEPGIPSQQTPSDGYNNLFAAVQRYVRTERGASKPCSEPYVALHHRLDRETGGIMIFALDPSVNRALGKAFELRKVMKEYLAWAAGKPPSQAWTSREDIGRRGGRYCTVPRGEGKAAETFFQVLHTEKDRTLVLARPRTGRTHQIRLHLAALSMPIVGDALYGGPPHSRLLLHAWRLTLPHPRLNKELCLATPLPDDWLLPDLTAIPAAPHTGNAPVPPPVPG